jgi:hypothetical protein
MIHAIKIRPIIFALGVVGVALSLSAFVASYFRHVATTDYLKEANEGIPWVEFGLATAASGIILCAFGRRWWRIAALGLALVLLIVWMFVGESLY